MPPKKTSDSQQNKKVLFTILYWLAPAFILHYVFHIPGGRISIYILTLMAIIAFYLFRPCNTSALVGGLLLAPLPFWIIVGEGHVFGLILAFYFFLTYTLPFLILSGILAAITAKDPDPSEAPTITNTEETVQHATEENKRYEE